MGEINNDKVCRLCKHRKTEYYICDIDNKHKDSEDTCEHFRSINIKAVRAFAKVQDFNFTSFFRALSIIIVVVIFVFVWILTMLG